MTMSHSHVCVLLHGVTFAFPCYYTDSNSASSRDTLPTSSICSSQNLDDGFGASPEETKLVSDSPTKLLETVLSTEVFGLIPLLYSLLLSPTTRMPSSPDHGREQRRQVVGDLGEQVAIFSSSFLLTFCIPSQVMAFYIAFPECF